MIQPDEVRIRGRSVSGMLFLILGGCCWLAGSDCACGQDDSPLLKQFLTEAPTAWKQQLAFYGTLEGTVRTESKSRKGGDGKWKVGRRKGLVKSSNENALDQLESFEDGAWGGDVTGTNSNYTFKLRRSSDNKPWAIIEVKQTDDHTRKRVAIRKEVCPNFMLSPMAPFLPSLVQQQGFRCIRVTPESSKGENLVRMTFAMTPEGSRSRLTGGWAVLDPSHYWVIRQSEVEATLGEKTEGVEKWTFHNDYIEGSNGHPIGTKSVMTDKAWQNGKLLGETESVSEFTFRERPAIPEEEFTLSAYNLPEPHWARPKKTPWILWFASFGIGCLVVAACVRQFKRRQTAAGA